MCALPSLNIRWVFKNTPPSSQSLVHAVYGVGCHTGQTGPFRHELQRRIAQKIFKPQKNAKVRLVSCDWVEGAAPWARRIAGMASAVSVVFRKLRRERAMICD